MSENIKPDEKVLNLVQVLDEMNSETIHLKSDQKEVECTYEMGPINQPILVCLTCSKDPKNLPCGVCCACASKCHENHELLELYSKRSFTCECGTDKLNGACSYNERVPNPQIRPRVTSNAYNHNFEGLYCLCNKPYDPYSDTDNMYQCHICYDWFHENCIGSIPGEDDDNDLICFMCVKNHTFLLDYVDDGLFQVIPIKNLENPESVPDKNDQDKNNSSTSEQQANNQNASIEPLKDQNSDQNKDKNSQEIIDLKPDTGIVKDEITHENKDSKRNNLLSDEDDLDIGNNESKRARTDQSKLDTTSPPVDIGSNEDPSKCIRPTNNKVYKDVNLFAYSDWKQALCQCERCQVLYFNEGVDFLLGEEVYSPPSEDVEEVTGSELFDTFLEDLNELPREQAIALTHVIKKIGSEFSEFMRPFAENNQVVTKEDVLKFLENRKKD